MTTIYLEPGFEKMAEVSPFPQLAPTPLYHQVRTLEALRQHDLVVNTYDTGTGKTRASLLYLFYLHEQNQRRRGSEKRNVLFVAPTNALLAQHTTDIREFVEDHDLDFRVQRVTAAEMRALETGLRAGETLQRLISNYLEFEPDETRPRPLLLVVNPDIYYYAMYFRYGAHDRRNVFEQFLLRFDYIVIDEFHYYDSKQLANFLFFFALFDQFGYFAAGRKVCLLSATPTPKVREYLARLFGAEGGRWAVVAPENEPWPSADLIPTLAPLEMTVLSDEIQEWVAAHRDALVRWVVDDDQDGAIISSSLWRINEAYAVLRGALAEARMGRITGPEPEESRVAATACDLILATPTVDIGYNFKKLGKVRQHVDFVICDARYGDELRQRVGRAGRLLGAHVTDQPSRAVVLVSDEAAAALAAYDGQTMSRAAFKGIINHLRDDGMLPDRHSLYGYIRSHAITESFWPIYQLGKMMTDMDHLELDALYDRVVEVFAPGSYRSGRKLSAFFREFEHRESWLRDAKRTSAQNPPPYTARRLSDWAAWQAPEKERAAPEAIEKYVRALWQNRSKREGLISFVEGQVALTRALFRFRESFQGPAAVVYDPQHLLSSETVNMYDLFHVVSHYHHTLMRRDEFLNACGNEGLQGDFYVALHGFREAKLSVMLSFETDLDRETFEAQWCCGEVMPLSGVRVVLRERKGDVTQTPAAIADALREQHIPALITGEADGGAVRSTLRGSDLWSRDLVVHYPDSQSRNYRVFLGAAAFHAQAELIGYFLRKERMRALTNAEACIIL